MPSAIIAEQVYVSARRRFIGVAGASLASVALPSVAGAWEAGFDVERFMEVAGADRGG